MHGRGLQLALAFVAIMGLGLIARAAEQPADNTPEPITPVPAQPNFDPRKITLGARLFNDTRLSGDGTRSCASCHDVNHNGAQPAGTAVCSAAGLNTLTIFNAALNYRLNWEGKYRTLEAQALASIQSPQVMNAHLPQIAEKLRGDAEMLRMFEGAYGGPPDPTSVIDALVTYERSLTTPGSRFDRWLAGEQTALTADEIRGYASFKSLGCVSCHQGMNVGGNLMQRQGIFHPLAAPNLETLRVPSLRNVATTAPYFHDGSAPTLDVAIRKMASAQLDIDVSDSEVQNLVAFLGSLTGYYRGRLVGADP